MTHTLHLRRLRGWAWLLGILSSFSVAAQDGNGIYSGSDTIPNNTISTVSDNFGIGVVQNVNAARGTYLWFNRSSQRLSLVTQGLVTLGDPNGQGLFPSWLEVNSQSGGIRGYASADVLFQVDTFFYSLRKGGLQLPDNVFGAPFLLQGDVGTIYFNRASGRLGLWDGERHRSIPFSDESRRDYQVLTVSTLLGSDASGLLYCKPDDDGMELQLPPIALADGREIMVKNISPSQSVSIVVNAGDTINGDRSTLTLAPNSGVRLHAMSAGWQSLGTF